MATTPLAPLRTLTIRGEHTTTVAMTDAQLTHHAEDIALLDLPHDTTGLQPLRGWNIHDHTGTHIGRVFTRASVVTAEWYDPTEGDWILARWGCRRLHRAAAEILNLRDEVHGAHTRAAAQRRAADYRAHLASQGLELDRDGEEVPAGTSEASLHLAA